MSCRCRSPVWSARNRRLARVFIIPDIDGAQCASGKTVWRGAVLICALSRIRRLCAAFLRSPPQTDCRLERARLSRTDRYTLRYPDDRHALSEGSLTNVHPFLTTCPRRLRRTEVWWGGAPRVIFSRGGTRPAGSFCRGRGVLSTVGGPRFHTAATLTAERRIEPWYGCG